MTFDYVIIPEKRCIAQRYTGEMTLKDIISCTEAMWADPQYDRSYKGVTDLTLTVAKVHPSEIPELISFLRRPETSTGQWAAIFSEPKGTALGVLFKSAINSHLLINIFSSWDVACETLHLDITPSVFMDAA